MNFLKLNNKVQTGKTDKASLAEFKAKHIPTKDEHEVLTVVKLNESAAEENAEGEKPE